MKLKIMACKCGTKGKRQRKGKCRGEKVEQSKRVENHVRGRNNKRLKKHF